MAKKSSETFHGWTIEHGTRVDGKPTVTASKPGRNAVTTIGRTGGDPDVLVQRVKVYALEQDVDAASGDERQAAQDALHEATVERDVARAVRVAAAAAREAAEARRGGE